MKIKKFIGIFLCLLIVGLNFALIKNINKSSKSEEDKVLITLWQIDTFPGGKGSRTEFLKRVSTSFEKKEKVFISIYSYSLDSANNLLSKGVYPDIISYGNGLNLTDFSKIDATFSSGEFNGESLAIPWARSKYFLLYKGDLELEKLESLTVLDYENTLPLMALLKENISVKNIEFTEPSKGVRDFINGKESVILGTNRDIIRLENKLLEYNLYPLDAFSDLYQYFSITTKDESKLSYLNGFINYITGIKVQEGLKNLSLYSPYYDISLDEERLNLNDKKPTFTINPFYSKEKLTKIKDLSLLGVKGDKDALFKLENYYCKI